MMTLAKEQEILMNIADMLIELYVSESVLLRVEKLSGQIGSEAAALKIDMMRVYLNDAADRIQIAGKNAINSYTEGDEQKMMLMGLRRFTKVQPMNTKDARQRVAQEIIAQNKYCF